MEHPHSSASINCSIDANRNSVLALGMFFWWLTLQITSRVIKTKPRAATGLVGAHNCFYRMCFSFFFFLNPPLNKIKYIVA